MTDEIEELGGVLQAAAEHAIGVNLEINAENAQADIEEAL